MCNSTFESYRCANRKYCSLDCASLGKRGEFNPAKSVKVRLKISQARKGKSMGNKNAVGNKQNPANIQIARARMQLMNLINNPAKDNISLEKRSKKVRMEGTFSGKNNPNWKGGITNKNMLIRNSKEYVLWREGVFKRDNYICQISGIKGGKLVSHHLEGFNHNKSFRLEVDNGITLTKKNHDLFHKLYGKGNNTLQQFEEYRGNICG